jgi:tetratricopeptide (TPR) repeat protein
VKRPRRAVAAAAIAALLAAGCASTPLEREGRAASGLPRAVEIREVPFFPQESLQCGPAALAAALGWAGEAVTPEELSGQVFTPALGGTLESALVAGARRHARLVHRIRDERELLLELAAGNPVVVLQQRGLEPLPLWHWAVAIGYELDEGVLVMHSGATPARRIGLGRFDRTWSRGGRVGLVVLPPERLAATASEERVLEAAAALEQAGQPVAAARAYASALERWPASFGLRMGLGNSLYAQGDVAGAARAFAAAAEGHPAQAAAQNNLAHALARLGRREDALAAARRAVELGGPDADTYRATLREIQESAR